MAGAITGLITGGVLGFAGQKYQEKEQQRQQVKQLELKSYFDHIEQDPTIVNNPEWQKGFKKVVGDEDAYQALLTTFKVHAASKARQQQQLQQFMQGVLGGGQAPQEGSPSAAPTGRPTPQMTAPPSTLPATRITGPAVPSAAPTQAPAPQTAPQTDYHAAFRQLEQAEAGMLGANLDPDQQKAVKGFLDNRRKDLVEEMKASQKDEITPYQQAELYMHGVGLEQGLEIKKIELGLQEQQKQFMQQMASEKEQDARQAHFQTGVQNLGTQTQKVASMLTASSPADQNTVKTLLNARNSQARMLKQQADKYGIDYDPEQFKPLTVKQVQEGTWQKWFGGTTPVLGEDTSASNAGPAGTPSSQAGAPKEGYLERNKKTGEYRQWQKGKWVSLGKGGPAT